MKSCLIVTGGTLDLEFSRSYLKEEKFDKIIAVDGGLAAMEPLGLIPDYIVGDFDTIDPEIKERYRQYPFIIWDAHKPEKDETDTELARSRALAIGCTKIVFLGATGGRIDHMLANLHTLYACMAAGVEAYVIDPRNRLCLIDGTHTIRKAEQWGKYVSFLPFTETVSGITLCGFKYPLEKKDITRGDECGLCISNEIEAEEAEVSFDDGILICMESRD